jgi:DNA-binding XRE family transcriptional regulator
MEASDSQSFAMIPLREPTAIATCLLARRGFAELVGISVDFLSLIERGINAPSFEVQETMAAGLPLPVRDLFDFKKELGGRVAR